jgi:hypothetical protein
LRVAGLRNLHVIDDVQEIARGVCGHPDGVCPVRKGDFGTGLRTPVEASMAKPETSSNLCHCGY